MSHPIGNVEMLRHVKAFDPPPAGFNPLTATNAQLHRHGFPHRPDPIKEPRLSALWHRALARPRKIIKAELRVGQPRRPLRLTESTFDLSGRWAGAQVNTSALGFDPRIEPANSVYGQWRVPVVVPPDNTGSYAVGFWVGLGGDQANNRQSVVQAGTQAVAQNGNVSYSAWTQWFPGQLNTIIVINFEVSPGDQVEFLVVTPQLDHGVVSMSNITTGFATTVGISVPGMTNDGTSAEWIVEGNGNLLADFFSVIFGQCIAGTKAHDFKLASAFADTILSADGSTTLAGAGIISPQAVGVIWESAGP